MKTLEERLNTLPPNNCRVCEHYIRVNFEGYKNVMNRLGFCLLGQLDGEYSLYLSTSVSKTCMAFILSEKNLAITEAEHQLDKEADTYLETLRDKRTKNYKDIEPLVNACQGFLESTEGAPKGLAWMQAEMKTRTIACEHFRKMNKERFKEIYDMVTLTKSDYSKFLAMLSIEIHDRFCKCDKIGFIEKTPERPDSKTVKIKQNLN